MERLKHNVEISLDNLEDYKALLDKEPPGAQTNSSNISYEDAQQQYAALHLRITPFLDENGDIMFTDDASIFHSSRAIQDLKLEYNSVKNELQQRSSRYGPKHPTIITLTEKLSALQSKIEQTKQAVFTQIKFEYNQAQTHFKALDKPQNQHYKPFVQATPEKFAILRAHAEEALRIYTEYETTYEGIRASQTHIPTTARILKRATTPQKPSFPNKLAILELGTLISFILGILLALFIEKTRNTFISGRQLEEYLNLPCYALIPNAPKDKDKPLADYVLDHPSSTISEAVRALRLVLRLRADAVKEADQAESKVVTITSSFPNEGKTTLSSWLARLAAKSGERVILIDADLRRPSVHKGFGKKNSLSLVEYLGGKNKLEDIINTNDPSGLHIIYGRAVPNSALDLLSSDKMSQLIRSLRKAYDLIIIDSPACMAVSDARALDKFSDLLLYTVQWNKTSREIVHNGMRQFTQFGNTGIATVLMNIDLQKHVKFGYGETINHYDAYKEYSTP